MRVVDVYIVCVFLCGLTADTKAADRNLQVPVTCGVDWFSVYNSKSNSFAPLDQDGKLFLDTYPNKMINIIANTVTDGCPISTGKIGCVKMKFGAFASTREVRAPYTLYKSKIRGQTIATAQIPANVSGWQSLEAWAYSSSNCTTKTLLNYIRHDIQIFQKSIKSFTIPITAIYNNVISSLVKPSDVAEVVSTSCSYILQSLTYIYAEEATLYVNTFECTGNHSSTIQNQPPGIMYNINISFGIGQNYCCYPPILPSLNETVRKIFADIAGGPGNEEYVLSGFVKSAIKATNPFIQYSNITIK